MNLKMGIIFGGIITGALIFLLFALPFFFSASGVVHCPEQSPGHLFSIQNNDGNKSHSIHVTITSSSNETIAEESYVIAPMMTSYSQYLSTTQPVETFFVTFVVDGKIISHGTILSTTKCSTSFSLNPVEGVNGSNTEVCCRDQPCPL